ncbi:3741_t:CDS:10 [Entrophospora sp. SA101]|nr:3741_t:CDS:10 [Entrophospora sp. SA101]CAJ0851244.1 9029_t:CDS:10 [Entrophospora sp. SA101]
MPFGQIVIGPPGSGKTTYSNGMQQFLTATERKVSVINLDPANDHIPYQCAINITNLITLKDVMETYNLGPNGGMMYCMEFLEVNFDWLEEKLKELKDDYLLFDFPGQVELFTHHNSVKNIIDKLQKLDYRLVTVHLVDAHYCTDPSKYISILLLSLKTMLQIELPHINVLSKIDLMESYGKLVQDLSYLLQKLDKDPFTSKFKELNKALCGLIEDFSLVGFYTLCIEDKKSVSQLIQVIDRANGYIFNGLTSNNESIMMATIGNDPGNLHTVMEVQEQEENGNTDFLRDVLLEILELNKSKENESGKKLMGSLFLNGIIDMTILVTVHLVDAHYCTDPSKYISILLLSLKTMLQIELPHINVLSKIDLMESYGKLVQDLSYLLQKLDKDPFTSKFKELNKALCGLIEDFSLVGFYTLCIEDKKSVSQLIQVIDRANGYIFNGLTSNNESIMMATIGNDPGNLHTVMEVQEQLKQTKETERLKLAKLNHKMEKGLAKGIEVADYSNSMVNQE